MKKVMLKLHEYIPDLNKKCYSRGRAEGLRQMHTSLIYQVWAKR
jgi:hypothetical protein